MIFNPGSKKLTATSRVIIINVLTPLILIFGAPMVLNIITRSLSVNGTERPIPFGLLLGLILVMVYIILLMRTAKNADKKEGKRRQLLLGSLPLWIYLIFSFLFLLFYLVPVDYHGGMGNLVVVTPIMTLFVIIVVYFISYSIALKRK